MRYIRWKALLPLSVTLVVIATVMIVVKDRAVRWSVEAGGTAAVGAKVDLDDAHLALAAGHVTLRGLAVTNPNFPMRNLFEAEELVFDVDLLPALERKVVVDTVAVRGLRFGTARAASGAIPHKEPGAAATSQVIAEWKSRVRIPPLELSTLTRAVNVEGIAAESLATLREASHARAYADTAKAKLLADLEAADPRPTLDSAEALANRLRNANLATLGIAGARRAVSDVRRTIGELSRIDDRLRTFDAEVRGNAAGLQGRLDAIGAARTADYAYARSLLRLPTFDIPSIGPQLFSDLVAEQFAALLYWVQMAERYMPPGLQRQFQRGPERVRASGTDVLFPRERVHPTFLLRLAELSLSLGGEGATAGNYRARLVGVTSQPAVYGAPTSFLVERAGGQVGPRDARVEGMLDHRTANVRDTLSARFSGIALPQFPLAGLGATVVMGQGLSDLQLDRRGDSLTGRWLWRAPNVTWVRDSAAARATTPTMRLVEDAIWRAVSRLDSVEIEARVGGSVRHPALAIRTNIASAVGNALREQLGEEVRRAEQQVRARVDALVAERVAEARTYADGARADVTARIAAERERVETQKAALEARLRELARIPGVG
ncbi:MAG: TIGR03545 family protein [Gemmatimonadaceae bacterium]